MFKKNQGFKIIAQIEIIIKIPVTFPAYFSESNKKEFRTPFGFGTQYFFKYEIYLSFPKKKTATTPGPVCEPITEPISAM